MVELCPGMEKTMKRIKIDNAEALLAAVAELERLIGRLYECLAGSFPEDSIWAGMAGEEAYQARLAVEMKSLLSGKDWILCDSRFNSSIIDEQTRRHLDGLEAYIRTNFPAQGENLP